MAGRADRLYRLDEPQGHPLEQFGRQSRAETSSREALRQRLVDLPPWHPSSPRADRPSADARPDQATDEPGGSFREQVPRFEAMWEAHVRRWPDKPRRGDQSLSPEQSAQADRLIADLQRPEKQITALLQDIERDNSHGGVLVGLEHRLKGPDRLKEKIAERGEHELGVAVAEAVAGIYDAVRYTFLLSAEDYVVGSGDIRQRLESAGYQMIYSKNHWLDDPEYKGVNTRWTSPTGDRFELQFHTAESLYAKENLTHDSYDRLRAPGSRRAEQQELHAYQRLVCSAIASPARVHEIADVREPT